MYCMACGTQNPSHGKFCLQCGKRLVQLSPEDAQPLRMPVQASEEDMLRNVLQTDPRPNECHRCGSRRTRSSLAISPSRVSVGNGFAVATACSNIRTSASK